MQDQLKLEKIEQLYEKWNDSNLAFDEFIEWIDNQITTNN